MRDSTVQCKWLHEQVYKLPGRHHPFEKSQLPSDGIYFFSEEGEIWGHDSQNRLERIVRIGSHKEGNFGNRILKDHYAIGKDMDNLQSNRPGPKERSIFRRNIGHALLNKEGYRDYLPIWNKDFTSDDIRQQYSCKRNMELEIRIEKEISDILKNNFHFRFISLDAGEVEIGSKRLEFKLIGTVSNCKMCKPSESWLGNYSPIEKIRQSGLWLVDGLYSEPLISKADSMKFGSLVDNTVHDWRGKEMASSKDVNRRKKVYFTHCTFKKDDRLKDANTLVRPEELYIGEKIQGFIKKCKEVGANWAVFSDKYGLWLPDEKHYWYEKSPNDVTTQEFEGLVNSAYAKLKQYDDIYFYANHKSPRFHSLYKELKNRLCEVGLNVRYISHISEIH